MGLLLAGCAAVGPDFVPPVWQDVPQAYRHASGEFGFALRRDTWWSVFNDQVSRLEERAVLQNSSLKAAAARLLQAQSQLAGSKAAALPKIGLGASIERLRTSGTTPQGTALRGLSVAGKQYTAGASMTYELDLWGRLKRIKESTEAQSELASADHDGVLLTLSTQLAATYWQWRGAQAEADIVLQLLKVQDELQQLTNMRFDAGLSAESEIVRVQVDRANTAIELENLRRQIDGFEHAICVFAGCVPSSPLPPEWVAAIALPVEVPI